LRRAAPELSAHTVLFRRQKVGLILVGAAVVAGAAVNLLLTLQIVVALGTAMYAATLIYRLLLVRRGLQGSHMVRVSDEDALAVPAAMLPVYSVLVPAYREPEVIAKIISAVSGLD
jgi:hypothetical protein